MLSWSGRAIYDDYCYGRRAFARFGLVGKDRCGGGGLGSDCVDHLLCWWSCGDIYPYH